MTYRIRWLSNRQEGPEPGREDVVGRLLAEARPSPEILPAPRSRAVFAYAVAEARRQSQRQSRRRGTAWALCTAAVLMVAAAVHIGREVETSPAMGSRMVDTRLLGRQVTPQGENTPFLLAGPPFDYPQEYAVVPAHRRRHRRRHHWHPRTILASVPSEQPKVAPREPGTADRTAQALSGTSAPPAGRLIVLVTDAPPPLKVTVRDAPPDAPGYACASASDPDPLGGLVRRQCTIEMKEHSREAKQITLARLETGILPALLTIQTISDSNPAQKGDKP